MSRFRVVRRGHTIGGSTNSVVPELTGVPRDGEAAWLDAGTWSSPNLYRFKLYRDGVLYSTVSQADPAYYFAWTSSEVGKAPFATVEASTNSGSSWSPPVAAQAAFVFPSDVITPATIPTGTISRSSTSGTLPMVFTVDAEVYSSYQWEILVLDTDGVTELYQGFKGVAESELSSPFTVDWSGATDPAPEPPMPNWSTLSATPALLTAKLRLVSADYLPGDVGPFQGVVGPWMVVTPTDAAGHRYWKFDLTAAGAGNNGNIVITEIETATTTSGVNNATGRTYTYSSGAEITSGTFASSSMFNGVLSADQGGLTGQTASVTIDYGINTDLHEARITSHPSYYFDAPSSFTLSYSDNGTSWTSVISPTGITWSNSVHQTRAWTF